MDAETTDQAEAGLVPPEIAALAANMDAELGGQAVAPGAELVQADTRAAEAAELAAMLGLAVKFSGYVEPSVPKYYTDAACADISMAYIECAEKYGWTWHKGVATGPELKLAFAIGVPGFMIWKERRERAEAEALAAMEKARERARQQTSGPVPTAPAGPVVMQPGERIMPSGS